jgi:hypothetical protein
MPSVMNDIGRDIKNLLRKLLLHRHEYFSGGFLNSDGRRVFEEAARMLIHEKPFLKRRVRSISRTGAFEDVLKLAREVLTREELEEIIRSWYTEPYIRYADLDDFFASSYFPSGEARSTDRMPSSSK